MRAEIHAANLHHGGGAVGAASFVADLPRLSAEGRLDAFTELAVVLSTTVARNVPDLDAVRRVPRCRVEVRDDRPTMRAVARRRQAPTTDVRFVVRGPHYGPLDAGRTIAGFADGSMYFPAPMAGEGRLARLAHEAKNVLKRRLLAHYDGYVVQTERLAARLRRSFDPTPVWVVPNSPADVFWDPDRWVPTPLPPRTGTIRFFYPARGYAHKNHAIIGPLGELLRREHGVELEVVTTLRDDELAAQPEQVRQFCRNVGEVTVAQCPDLYRQCDGVFFPSLNETASATPLEGMAMRRPVVASDRDFVRLDSGEVPVYFDPLDARSAADAVMAVVEGAVDDERLETGYRYVRSLPSSFERSCAYVGIISGEVPEPSSRNARR